VGRPAHGNCPARGRLLRGVHHLGTPRTRSRQHEPEQVGEAAAVDGLARELLGDVDRGDGLRAEDLDRIIKRRLEALKQAKGSAASIAGRVNGPVLYGAAHPYGRIPTEASYAAITLDDCKAYHQQWIHPGGGRLFVVGDLTEKQIRGYFEGLELLEPGLVPTSQWRPHPGTEPAALDVYCAVGRKP